VLQRPDGEVGGHAAVRGVADDAVGAGVLDRTEVELALGGRVLSDVGQPQLVGSLGGDVAQHPVVVDRRIRAREGHQPAPGDLRCGVRAGRPRRAGCLDQQRDRAEVPGDQAAVGSRLGAGHPVLRVPARGPQGPLHDRHDREHQLPTLKISKTRGHSPNDDALIKLLYLGVRDMGRAGNTGSTTKAHGSGRASYSWKIALNQFDIMFPGRLDRA
jgi:hypothetical protein